MKNNAIINLALIVIIGGYLFFFTSNLWIPHNASAKKQTPLNESVEWADRAITIERWDYCERSRLMEVYMDIKSNTYDGIYAYKYEAVDRSEDNLKVSAAVEEPEWIVLRISGISNDFGEISLRLTHRGDTIRLYTNVKKVNRVKSLQKKSKKDYQIIRMKTKISQYQKTIAAKEKKIELLKATNERLNNEIERLQSDLEYQTESEKQNTADRVEDIKENIDQNTADINERYRQIEERNNRIRLIREQIDQIK